MDDGMIHVYPKATVYCPKNQCEQHQDICATCPLYRGHRINTDRFHIVCAFEG